MKFELTIKLRLLHAVMCFFLVGEMLMQWQQSQDANDASDVIFLSGDQKTRYLYSFFSLFYLFNSR